VTDARVQQIHEDRETGRSYLAQAEDFLADARNEGNTNESRAVLIHSAVIAACDAVLAAEGLRVGSGERAHILRIDTALDQLDGDTTELNEALDAARARRNDASYNAMPVAGASVADGIEAAASLIERARRHVA
jgi:hypothetical protein